MPQPDATLFHQIDCDEFVLACLARSKAPLSLALLQRRLKSYVAPDRTSVAVDALAGAGLVLAQEKFLELSNEGVKSAAKQLGKDKKYGWDRLVKSRFPIQALGLDPDDAMIRKKMSNASVFKAAVVGVGYGLPISTILSPVAVRSELVWQCLRGSMSEIVGKGPFREIDKSNIVDRTILGGLAGVTVKSVEQAMNALAAKATGSPKTDLESIRRRLITSRVAVGASVAEISGRTSNPSTSSKPNGTYNEESHFSERVRSVSAGLATPPFQGRVAIAQVYDAYGSEFSDAGSLDSFKARLIASAKKRELELARLDLPERMAKGLRQRSHTPWNDDEVHFVVNEWK